MDGGALAIAGLTGGNAIALNGIERLIYDGENEHEALRQALIDGENSGPGEPFDRKAFQAEMRAKHARPE